MNRTLMFLRTINWLALVTVAMVVVGAVLALVFGGLLVFAGALLVGAVALSLINLTN